MFVSGLSIAAINPVITQPKFNEINGSVQLTGNVELSIDDMKHTSTLNIQSIVNTGNNLSGNLKVELSLTGDLTDFGFLVSTFPVGIVNGSNVSYIDLGSNTGIGFEATSPEKELPGGIYYVTLTLYEFKPANSCNNSVPDFCVDDSVTFSDKFTSINGLLYLYSYVNPLIIPTNVSPTEAIEYYWPAKDHYFITADLNEIHALDNHVFVGWERTGESFNVYPPDNTIDNASPVCRYYGLPSAGIDSHFYSAFPFECSYVATTWPDQWQLESNDVFKIYQPNSDGSCRVGTSPVYRLYDNRVDVNHRYTTDLDTREDMINQGWIPEGYGPLGVGMCSPN